ncbi:MAG: Rne/Rng family ribonuclease [Terracidiphilus sp.]
MAKEICISSTPHETRLAILEDDQLAEIYYERENEYTLAGSIYNGRVTRVLPGMQSAFVDLGLERDAFLYVTDFLEMEDPEDSDEIEKAAVTGGAQAPREVRHGNNGAQEKGTQDKGAQDRGAQDRNEGRGDEKQRAGARGDQKPGSRSERGAQAREGRMIVEPVSETNGASPELPAASGEQETGQDGSSEAGAKRWRGRRRRRGGRGSAGSPQGTQFGPNESAGDDELETTPESLPGEEIQASSTVEKTAASTWSGPTGTNSPTGRSAAPAAFVLPGESLRKYGGTADEEAPRAAATQPARPASSFKPATLIEAPLAWDGSGLLPGESISRHRTRMPEAEPQAEISSEPYGDSSESEHLSTESPDALEEREYIAEQSGPSGEHSGQPFGEPAAPGAHEYEEESVIDQPSNNDSLADPVLRANEVVHEFAAEETPANESLPDESLPVEGHAAALREAHSHATQDEEPDADASASHHIDSVPPSGFRLFGLGSKKKAEAPAPITPEPAPKPAASATSTVTVSSYAPGSGLIEEEVIDEEEFDAPHHHIKSDDHDLEDYEEETLPTQIRSGDLGELLQEAHLDHKIQLNFDSKNGDEEDGFDDDEEDEEEDEAVAVGPPATGSGQESSTQKRDRGGRGRRGRGGQQAGQQGGQGQRRGMTRRSAQTSDLPIISDLLKPGQEILVQIAKEPIAKKGARITSHIALPGRFLVFMPTVSHIGVSRKIASDEERQRLKRVLVHERGEATGGFIVRTAAEGASEEDLRADLRFLIHLWDEIKTRSDNSKSPALIYHDLSLIERILRDQVSANFSSIWVDSQDDYERIVRFLNRFSPSLVRRVKLYTKEIPLFEHFGIQDEISKALRSKVWLKSGGSIVINQTEALVAIDINTGKYVGKSARLEDTILKTNLDAVPEIVRQIRLRDLGGIIVIDFIDMDERKNRFKVMAALEEALKSDRAPTKVLQFNDFGLVAITRKRVKQSLERTLSVPCPTCQATGMVKSPTTVCNEIYTELRKMKKHFEGADVLLRVNPETVKVLKQNNAAWLTEFEELISKNVLVKSDATLHPEQFDIQG